MSEFAPVGWKPKMTRAQVRQYQKNMQAKREEAQKQIEEAKLTWDYYADNLDDLEKKLDNLL